jgi:hypothetical protein
MDADNLPGNEQLLVEARERLNALRTLTVV